MISWDHFIYSLTRLGDDGLESGVNAEQDPV